MKNVLSAILAAAFLLSLWGCGKASGGNEADTPNPSEFPISGVQNQTAQKPMIAVALPVVTEEHTSDDGTVLLRSVYQNMELTVPDPEVADRVIVDFLNRTDLTSVVSTDLLSQARAAYASGTDFTPYLSQIIFTPTRIDQGVLSLFGECVVHRGSAHPEVTIRSVTYDLTSGDVLTGLDILSDETDTAQLLQAVLDALASQSDTLYDGFENTVKTLVKDGNNWYFSREGLVFYFSPYEIAPYASGVITATVPYEKLPGILKDAYFPVERDTPQGQLLALPFTSENMEHFTQISEVVCGDGSRQAAVYTDGLLEDIRVELSGQTTNYTVFSAATLSPKDAIIIHGEENYSFYIHYKQGETSVTRTLTFSQDGTPLLS